MESIKRISLGVFVMLFGAAIIVMMVLVGIASLTSSTNAETGTASLSDGDKIIGLVLSFVAGVLVGIVVMAVGYYIAFGPQA